MRLPAEPIARALVRLTSVCPTCDTLHEVPMRPRLQDWHCDECGASLVPVCAGPLPFEPLDTEV